MTRTPCTEPHLFSYLHTNMTGEVQGSAWCLFCGTEMTEEEKEAELKARKELEHAPR